MSTLLEITGDDIAQLNDTDLRALIGQLCEADFRLAGLPTTGILWGGHQDASDGGVDVSVRGDVDPPSTSYVPKSNTIFQVKASDMPRSKIIKEMKPKGKLRPEIKKLIEAGGAYIIVSSRGSTTEKALKDRVDAMRMAVAEEPNGERLHLDFLDRGRVATWVRNHPLLILWVRDKIGKPLQGWQPYGNWANTKDGDEYIVDQKLRLYDTVKSQQYELNLGEANIYKGETVLDGLQKLRTHLTQEGSSIRLIGLSGVGKTRLVQALFDDRVGKIALDPPLAHYMDISDSPLAEPYRFAYELVATQKRAILIVDNCSSDLHRKLTKICSGKRVSLLTIEYDIRDDLVEETKVFRLEPASDDLIEKLLKRLVPDMGHTNIRTIAKFASGNARVAMALASTLKEVGELSTLRYRDLFEKLFYQRDIPSENLIISAEVLSLVYSFDGHNRDSESELQFLADLAGKDVRQLYRDISELRKRGLVQSRSVWRAVLPHAIANRLAKQAFDSIPPKEIEDAFKKASERLLQSFTHRLSYLHDCQPVIELAERWLKPNGFLGETNCNFSELGFAIFKNIAPVVPEATLSMLERAINSSDNLEAFHTSILIHLLRQLAYEIELFQRSARLLCRLALLEKKDNNNNDSARAVLHSLFLIMLSGTQASIETRVPIISQLINSDNEANQELGIYLLDAGLQTHHFSTSYTSTFGARARDYGYYPHTNEEVLNWYRTYLNLCTGLVLSDKFVATNAQRLLAKHLRGLWEIGVRFDLAFLDELEQSAIRIHEQISWPEGWIAIKRTLRSDQNRMEPQAQIKLQKLAKRLQPSNLLEKAQAYVLIGRKGIFALIEDVPDEGGASKLDRINAIARQIGTDVAKAPSVFEQLLPKLFSSNNGLLFAFGQGLGDGCQDRKDMWQSLYTQLEKTNPENREIDLLLGFISSCAIHDRELCHSILDSLVDDKILGQQFPSFQTAIAIDARGLTRLHQSLDIGIANAYSFGVLRQYEIADDDFADLIRKLITKEDGIIIAVEILGLRFFPSKDKIITCSPQLQSISNEVLLKYPYEMERDFNDIPDDDLAQIAGISLRGQGGIQASIELCHHLLKRFQEHGIPLARYPQLLGQLAQTQPFVFLDTFCQRISRQMVVDIPRKKGDRNPINQIPEHLVIEWCEREPESRYPLIVSAMQMYSKLERSQELHWLSIFFLVLEKSPNVQSVLLQFEKRLIPITSYGSKADAIEMRLVLLEQLASHTSVEVQEWASKQHKKLILAIEKERELELQRSQRRFGRF